jgi:hypothetical protein
MHISPMASSIKRATQGQNMVHYTALLYSLLIFVIPNDGSSIFRHFSHPSLLGPCSAPVQTAILPVKHVPIKSHKGNANVTDMVAASRSRARSMTSSGKRDNDVPATNTLLFYTADMTVGNQEFTVIVDTGSANVGWGESSWFLLMRPRERLTFLRYSPIPYTYLRLRHGILALPLKSITVVVDSSKEKSLLIR